MQDMLAAFPPLAELARSSSFLFIRALSGSFLQELGFLSPNPAERRFL